VVGLNRAQEVLTAIAADLQINQFAGEPEPTYTARLIYSALGMWMLHCPKDSSILEDERATAEFKLGVSKNYILNRCSEILGDLLEIFPHANSWFNIQQKEDCSAVVRSIRNIYEAGGYLIPGGTEVSLTLAQSCGVLLENGLALVRGPARISKMIGLGLFERMTGEKEDIHNLYRMFLIPFPKADEYVREYMQKTPGGKGIRPVEGSQFFNPKSPLSLSKSWIESCPKDTPTLYKKGFREYGLIQYCQEEFTSWQLPEHLVKEHEVRRFLYGIKGMSKNKARARLHLFRDVAFLRLYNALPRKESILLKLLAWPAISASDESHYYVPLEVLSVVQEILNHLCIELEEI